MWQATATNKPKNGSKPAASDSDDWESDEGDYVNEMTEQERRYGKARPAPSGNYDLNDLREKVICESKEKDKRKVSDASGAYNVSRGYGGKFGVEADRMDKGAVGHDYQAKLEKHASQKDYATGFGGKYGVQNERKDKV